MNKKAIFFHNKEARFFHNKEARFLRNKKADNIVLEYVIFIVLNVMFFGILMLFVIRSSSGVLVLEQVYAKQIALLIDSAKPGTITQIYLDEQATGFVHDYLKNCKDAECCNKARNLIHFDDKEKRVVVSLDGKKGYSYQTFTNYDVEVCWKSVALIYVHKEGDNERACKC